MTTLIAKAGGLFTVLQLTVHRPPPSLPVSAPTLPVGSLVYVRAVEPDADLCWRLARVTHVGDGSRPRATVRFIGEGEGGRGHRVDVASLRLPIVIDC